MCKKKDIKFETPDINKAYKQLSDRYAALNLLNMEYPENNNLKENDKEIKKNIDQNSTNKNLKEKLVITDLFVEKDILVLEDRAKSLTNKATWLYRLTIFFLLLTALLAYSKMDVPIQNIENIKIWQVFVIEIIKSFTTYGLLVLLAVTTWKHSKAKFDQAERLYAKRRQNRQLRLFVHLNEGKITHKEFLEFLEFGKDENNAYEQIKTDAKAPLGSVVSDLLKTQGSIIKALTPKES